MWVGGTYRGEVMRLSELVAALEAIGAKHGDVRVMVVGCDDGDGLGFGVHTAPWARADGGEVTACLDVTAEVGSVGD